jgi:hypothetical protein
MEVGSDHIPHGANVGMIEERHDSCFSCRANFSGMILSFSIFWAVVTIVYSVTRYNLHSNLKVRSAGAVGQRDNHLPALPSLAFWPV